MIAKASADPEKDIRDDIVVEFSGNRDLGYEQKWIWSRRFSALEEQENRKNETKSNPSPHRAEQ